MRKLAILGGEPAFPAPLHVGRPNIGDREQFMTYTRQMFDNRWLSNYGPLVKQFEQELCQFLGVKHVITVCNATIGLEVAIRALDLHGEVIVPSFTFIATAHALQWQGITPIFADIDPLTHNLDPRSVENLITPRTSGILGVHLWGRPAPVEALEQIAKKHQLKLLFDAAHAFGCSHQGQMIGNFGQVEVFSFHATKFFNTFEGGAIVTNDDELANRMRRITNFGFSGHDKAIDLGINAKMTEPCAAMGLVNLQSLNTFVEVNRCNYNFYQHELTKLQNFQLIDYPEHERANFQYIVVEVVETETGLTRDEILTALRAENVLARRYFWPGCHQMEPYRTENPSAVNKLPVTEAIAKRTLVLPTGTSVGKKEIVKIVTLLKSILTNSTAIKKIIASYG
jgi:dTDP-4-amino-4,6-dideoxygalactose transaminase